MFRTLIPLNCTVLIYWTQHENGKKTSCLSNLFSHLEKLQIKLVGVTIQSIRVLGWLQSTRHVFVSIIYFILSTSSFSTTWIPFKYLGAFVADSKKDFLTRKAQAWKACNKLHIVWQSNISRKTKLAFFKDTALRISSYMEVKPGQWIKISRTASMALTLDC